MCTNAARVVKPPQGAGEVSQERQQVLRAASLSQEQTGTHWTWLLQS